MGNINVMLSYRSELEVIFPSLKHLEYLNITPREVRQWYDNERSVISSREAPTRIVGMIKADVDLILAIHHLRNSLKFQFQWIEDMCMDTRTGRIRGNRKNERKN